MKNFDAVFNAVFIGIFTYHIFYFLLQYRLLKRIELFYYSMFLVGADAYFFGFVTPIVFDFSFTPKIKGIFSAFEMSFAFIQNFFYILFIVAYLGITIKDKLAFKWMKFYKNLNLFYLIIFLVLGIFKIEGRGLMTIASVLTLPLTFTTLIILWRFNTVYSNVIIWGSSCLFAGTLTSYTAILYEIYAHVKLPFNGFVPFQIGLLLDLFILGYGLSLKTAETDKKLVASLVENQKIVETERTRLAKDLHDGLGGMLSGIKLSLGSISGNKVLTENNAAVFTKVLYQLDNTIAEMRRVAHSMMPEALLKFGLTEAIEDYCDGVNESNAVKMKFTSIGLLQPLPQTTEIVLYRIFQELSNNAIKHAAAKNIFVQLNKHERGITITVEDDGKGFDTRPLKKGAGLQNVQSRLDYLKGFFNIESEPGKGTSVTVEIPVENITLHTNSHRK